MLVTNFAARTDFDASVDAIITDSVVANRDFSTPHIGVEAAETSVEAAVATFANAAVCPAAFKACVAGNAAAETNGRGIGVAGSEVSAPCRGFPAVIGATAGCVELSTARTAAPVALGFCSADEAFGTPVAVHSGFDAGGVGLDGNESFDCVGTDRGAATALGFGAGFFWAPAFVTRLRERAFSCSNARCCACSSLNDSVSANERRLLLPISSALSSASKSCVVALVGFTSGGVAATRCFFDGGTTSESAPRGVGSRAAVSSSVLSSSTIRSEDAAHVHGCCPAVNLN